MCLVSRAQKKQRPESGQEVLCEQIAKTHGTGRGIEAALPGRGNGSRSVQSHSAHTLSLL